MVGFEPRTWLSPVDTVPLNVERANGLGFTRRHPPQLPMVSRHAQLRHDRRSGASRVSPPLSGKVHVQPAVDFGRAEPH